MTTVIKTPDDTQTTAKPCKITVECDGKKYEFEGHGTVIAEEGTGFCSYLDPDGVNHVVKTAPSLTTKIELTSYTDKDGNPVPPLL